MPNTPLHTHLPCITLQHETRASSLGLPCLRRLCLPTGSRRQVNNSLAFQPVVFIPVQWILDSGFSDRSVISSHRRLRNIASGGEKRGKREWEYYRRLGKVLQRNRILDKKSSYISLHLGRRGCLSDDIVIFSCSCKGKTESANNR